jgi:hypothetical protein
MRFALSPRQLLTSKWAQAYASCAVVALIAVWGHRFPAGIDLPQHANLFQIWAHLGHAETGYSFYYEILPFTPYLLTYLIAWPLAVIGGGMFAAKVLLSAAVLATPWQMKRWLDRVGGEGWWSLGGFVVALGFGYHWGFLSWTLSFPLAFAYFAALEDQRKEPSRVHIARAAALALALFFCHAMTFGICLLLAGVFALWEGHIRRIVVQSLHAFPVLLVVAWWATVPKRPPIAHPPGWPPEIARLATLFGGTFSAHAEYWWAVVGLGIVVVTFAVTKPTLAASPRRWLPTLFSLVGVAALPDTINNVWLIGTRAAGFVHAFAPGAVDPSPEPAVRRRTHALSWALVLAALLALNVRLYRYNEELDGLDEIIAAVEPGADVHGLVPETGGDSAVLGPWALGQVMAWITTVKGGILENDSGQYNTIPVQRRIDVVRPRHFRYYLTHGDVGLGQAMAAGRAGAPVTLARRAGRWNLFEALRSPLVIGGVTVVRWGQEWGELMSGQSVTGSPLTVAGTTFAQGLGTHSRSSIEVRVPAGAHRLTGKVGIDDAAGCPFGAIFRVYGPGHRELWTSGDVHLGEHARPFSVEVPGHEPVRDLLLQVDPVRSNDCGHVNWLDLAAQ